MKKYTQKQLRDMVALGSAVDVTMAHEQSEISEPYIKIGYAHGQNGCNGMLLEGCKTGKLYAVTKRSTAIFIF